MCGIAGLVISKKKGNVFEEKNYKHILETIRYRGPDSQDYYMDKRVWLGHVRLSIIDLTSAGNQPMIIKNGNLIITYNGEIYNYKELAKEYSLNNLHSQTDTEVIIRAFDKVGINIFKKLNGMFAFAIYNAQIKKLWLVRDRFGIKPLYYKIDSSKLYFGSEIKTINSFTRTSKDCDISSLHEWLYYGNALGENTLYSGIKKLPPGHFIELDMKSFTFTIREYWTPKEIFVCPKTKTSDIECVQSIQNLLEQSVKRQLVSDVPVGIFLSGGIDSSAITAFASKHYNGRISTFSAGFDFDKRTNELPKAQRIAEFFDTDHHEIHITTNDIGNVVEDLVYHHDMPFSDAANIPLYLMAKQISGKIKVVLQGDGGDEVFCGYKRYTTLNFY